MSLLDQLISYWKFDGNSNDSHGSNNGSDTGMSYTTGLLGQCAVFNGSGTIDILDNPSLSTGDIDFTISGWIQLANKNPNPFGNAIAGKWKYTTSNREYLLWYFDSTDRIRFDVSRNGVNTGTSEANTFGSPPLNTWIFVVAWHDSVGDTLNIQINNGAVDVQSYALGVFDSVSNWTFGSYDGQGFFQGKVDGFSFWKRILTTQERTLLYNGGNGLAYPFTSDSGFFNFFDN